MFKYITSKLGINLPIFKQNSNSKSEVDLGGRGDSDVKSVGIVGGNKV